MPARARKRSLLSSKERDVPISVIKANERAALLELFNTAGVEVMPCARCSKKSLKCVASEASSRCKECVIACRSCDGMGISLAAANKLALALKKINQEEEEAEDDLERVSESLIQAQKVANERLARLAPLRKQKRLLKERANEMISRGVQPLEVREKPPPQ
ncbi:hypothetical protein F5Y17DRAFT_452579 [Xylariaceae sp. FL0594]|nr:hypothetical protein F5Y17DRAFT_452579 [Xylariaceae sp. FL0594]